MGRELTKARHSLELSLAQVSQNTGIPLISISLYERKGSRKITPHLQTLMDYYLINWKVNEAILFDNEERQAKSMEARQEPGIDWDAQELALLREIVGMIEEITITEQFNDVPIQQMRNSITIKFVNSYSNYQDFLQAKELAHGDNSTVSDEE